MEENKYYTPSIEEFHVGFEYEAFYGWGEGEYNINYKEQWNKKTVTDINKSSYERAIYHVSIYNNGKPVENWDKEIRVKCLDQEDIESLGWGPYIYNLVDCWMINNYYLFWFNNQIVSINKDTHQIFRGTIKNRSELEKLMEQLNIK